MIINAWEEENVSEKARKEAEESDRRTGLRTTPASAALSSCPRTGPKTVKPLLLDYNSSPQ